MLKIRPDSSLLLPPGIALTSPCRVSRWLRVFVRYVVGQFSALQQLLLHRLSTAPATTARALNTLLKQSVGRGDVALASVDVTAHLHKEAESWCWYTKKQRN